mmetsp:Transcript_90887/g.231313  ORF Transcript_90887/g.231313 Transcript_90887/m.231313 type:complete len:211 (-) Transcript_90887:733-1365(-)
MLFVGARCFGAGCGQRAHRRAAGQPGLGREGLGGFLLGLGFPRVLPRLLLRRRDRPVHRVHPAGLPGHLEDASLALRPPRESGREGYPRAHLLLRLYATLVHRRSHGHGHDSLLPLLFRAEALLVCLCRGRHVDLGDHHRALPVLDRLCRGEVLPHPQGRRRRQRRRLLGRPRGLEGGPLLPLGLFGPRLSHHHGLGDRPEAAGVRRAQK